MMADEAENLYRKFRGSIATRIIRVGIRYGKRWLTRRGRANILIPESLAIIGHVNAIEYDCTRAPFGGKPKTVKARHVFTPGSRPVLAVGTRPGEIFLLGTRYKFTDRGIVDFNARGLAVDYDEKTQETKLLKGF